jgi:Zn-dependent protease with chaperone function
MTAEVSRASLLRRPRQSSALVRKFMKRIVLFLITNLAVLALLAVIARALGLDAALARQGLDMRGLLVMAAIIGFAGSFISLALSKWTAKHLMGVRVIESLATPTQAWLVDVVRTHAERSGIGMPEVGIFDAPEMNAFATGARRDHALVAVSSGLLEGMTREEAAAVLGHEMTHVSNGDMVTLALIQGVVNTFVIFLRVLLARCSTTHSAARATSSDGGRDRSISSSSLCCRSCLGSSPTWSLCGSRDDGNSALMRAVQNLPAPAT